MKETPKLLRTLTIEKKEEITGIALEREGGLYVVAPETKSLYRFSGRTLVKYPPLHLLALRHVNG